MRVTAFGSDRARMAGSGVTREGGQASGYGVPTEVGSPDAGGLTGVTAMIRFLFFGG
jgi:hypothetical protein